MGLFGPATKTIFKSKTFWVNVLGVAAAAVAGQYGVTVPVQYAVPLGGAINVALRFLATQPVSVTGN